jgi:acyl-CoA synthetase (NDP forming)
VRTFRPIEAPGEAVEAFMRLARHRRNQELLMETPPSIPEEFTPDTETARRDHRDRIDRRSAALECLRNQPDA